MTAQGEPRTVTELDLQDLATGAWILGTGGGGDPYHGLLNIQRLYREGRSVALLDPMDLADDDLVAVVAQMGAPLVSQERITDPRMITKAVTTMEAYLGRRFCAVMSVEIGGGNGIQPFLAAAMLDLPVIDADGMGRAFPSVFHTSFAVMGYRPDPLSLVDIRANSVVLAEAADWLWVERVSRAVSVVLGSRSFTCKAPRTGKEVKEGSIRHTVSQAIRIGRTVREARQRHADPIAALLESERGRLLFRGKVEDVARRVTAGFLRGTVRLQGLDRNRGQSYRIDFQNEFLIGYLDGRVQVTVPELICVLDSESGAAVGTEALRYGQRVTVIVLPAQALFLTERGLAHTGPRAFDYDLDFVSAFAGGHAP
ncbi:MAG: DUF917 domain-containing protein [Geminicoccaceae bacterium]